MLLQERPPLKCISGQLVGWSRFDHESVSTTKKLIHEAIKILLASGRYSL